VKKLTVALYVRKSKKTDKGESIDVQIKICKEYLERVYPEYEIEIVYYNEGEGKSGGDRERKKFKQLIKDGENSKYDVLICYRLDRIARNVAGFSDLIDKLMANGIDFISVKEQFDTTTPMGRAMMYIASVFAQLERELTAERIQDNMRELAKTGRWLGGTTPTGYKSEGYEIIHINEMNEDNEVVKKNKKAYKLKEILNEKIVIQSLFEKMLELKSLTGLETYLLKNDVNTKNGKRFTRFTLRSLLTNPVYAINDEDMYNYFKNNNVELFSNKEDFDSKSGIMAYNKTKQVKHKATIRNEMNEWIVAVGKHKGFIGGKTWISVQRLLKNNESKRYRKPIKNQALLSGILRCSCGAYMRPKIKSDRYYKDGKLRFHYMCEIKEISRKCKCQNSNIDGNKLDILLMEKLKEFFAPNSKICNELRKIKSIDTAITEEEDKVNDLKKMYKKNENELESLINRLKYVDISIINDINKEIIRLKEENIKIEKDIQKYMKNKGKETEMSNLEISNIALKVIEKHFEMFDELDIMKKREFIKLLIESAVPNKEANEIEIDLINSEKMPFFLNEFLVPTGENRK